MESLLKDKISGFIIINKTPGPTSHNIINGLRKITGIKKIGHAGTLDPIASGVLICAIGREATKKISQFAGMDKEYEAEIMLGAETDTYDRGGKVTSESCRTTIVAVDKIKKVINKFIGKQKQLPPMFSAVKVRGKKLYELARQGKTSIRPPTDIEIYDIKLIDYNWPKLKILVKCSSGTYIRSLAQDIGKQLGCGAYLNELKRTAIGKYRIEKAINLEKLDKNNYKDYFIIKEF